MCPRLVHAVPMSNVEFPKNLLGRDLIHSLGYGRRQKAIAVIDDDKNFGNLIVHLGRDMGFEVTHYESLADMGTLGKLADYEGIIIDFHLDELNGLEIAEYLHSFFPWIPAILTSADSEIARSKGMSRYVDGFVPKSRGPINLVKALDWAIENRGDDF